jgi:hypothetical protein
MLRAVWEERLVAEPASDAVLARELSAPMNGGYDPLLPSQGGSWPFEGSVESDSD